MSLEVPGIRRIGTALARTGPVRRVGLRLVAGRGLVLLYHRVGTEAHAPVVPTVSAARLAAHLDVLRASGRIVPLRELLEEPGRTGPRFAVTFDDDYASHATEALPVLTEAAAPATFFLCGRALHGLGAPWWERLEAQVVERGPHETARLLDLPAAAASPGALADACEGYPERQRRVLDAAPPGPAPLDAEGIGAITEAGMGIGYHTLHHPLLTTLDDRELAQALSDGRETLARHVGRPLDLFAYPHGKADRRVAAAVRRAGYSAAWTGWPAPLRPGGDAFLLPRWEPGRLDADAFAAAVGIRLLRTAPEHRKALRG